MPTLLTGGAAVACAAAVAFPSSIYPPPVKARGGALAACPNPSGLEPFNATARKGAVNVALGFEEVSLASDLRNSDRALWPQVRHAWRARSPKTGRGGLVLAGSAGGRSIAYATVVRYSCGSALVDDSLSVALAPRRRHGCAACVSSAFLVDRRGHALVYWLN